MEKDITSTTKKKVVYFTDVRLGLTSDGALGSDIRTALGDNWKKYIINLDPEKFDLGLAARFFPDLTVKHEISGNVYKLPNYSQFKGLASSLPKLNKAVAKVVAENDVIIATVPTTPIQYAAIINCLRLKKKLVIAVVGDTRTGIKYNLPKPLSYLSLPLTYVSKGIVKQADGVKYVTDSVLQEEYPAKSNAPTIGLSNVVIPELKTHHEKNLPDKLRLVSVAWAASYKGHQFVIKALPDIMKQYPDTVYTIAGEGQYLQTLKDLSKELDVEDHVNFLGYVSDKKRLDELIDDSSIFLLPSLTEGLPRSLIEAMARGIPCIGAETVGIKELLDESAMVKPGSVNELKDTILKFANDPEFATEQGRRNAEVAARYTEEHKEQRIARWEDLINNL
ncbi:MAG: glycosyltransferase family 4 protein [Micrococcaceae bacterium]